MKQPLVIATGNPHKVVELRAIFGERGFEVLGLNDLGGSYSEPIETGKTFAENAAIKAVSYAAQTGRACLADDSGLEVDALGGAPGVISSHYSTRGIDTGLSRADRDAANNSMLLTELEGVPRDRRTARFVCVMIVADPAGQVLGRSRGALEGWIGMAGEVPRGSNGFGYDPLFVLEDGRTGAELSAEEKNSRSHRGKAARAMAEILTRGDKS
jgi:XTP/dITP diphosphohydrolase